MHCAEFLRRLDETLDRHRSALDDDLAAHVAVCESCRNDWRKLKSCTDLLRTKPLSPDERFTDEVVESATASRQLQRRQQTTVRFSFIATVAVGLLVLSSISIRQSERTSTNDQPALPPLVQTHSLPSKADGFEEVPHMWSDWHSVATQLPAVREIWTETWSNSQSDSPLTASVTSGLRPVATTMSSAIKVIGQGIVPTYRTPPADDGQAAGVSRSSTPV